MSFSATDIYTASGSASLYNDWTSTVTKYDTSSFYNWEQDNLPLYDLEERTLELWEKAGYPTSSIPGMALAVSADATPAAFLANTNLFSDVSSCVAALPEVIRFPIIIEVANFGDLGKLELHNIKFAEEGSLEIINRGFAKVYNSTVVSLANDTAVTPVPVLAFASTTITPTLNDTSALSLSSTLLSATLPVVDHRLSATGGSFFTTASPSVRRGGIGVSIKEQSLYDNIASTVVGNLGSFVYEGITSDTTVHTLDISSIDPYTSTRIKRANPVISNKGTGLVYTNSLSQISVLNCDGPIYIRHFFVDGEAGVGGTGSDNGVVIRNSKVLLENYSIARCNEVGLLIENSDVTLSRTGFVYRVYERDLSTTRVSGKGIGIKASNSTVVVQDGNDSDAIGDDVTFSVSRCEVGVELNSTTLTGGMSRVTGTDETTGGSFKVETNTLLGLKAHNSTINLKGLLDVHHNLAGIYLSQSNLTYEQLCVESTQNVGLECVNSDVIWDGGKSFTTVGQTTRNQVDFSENGQDLLIDRGSSFGFKRSDSMNDTYGHMSFVSGHGQIVLDGNTAPLPSISVDNNSKAEFLHSKVIPRGLDTVHVTANSPSYGLAAKASNNSEIEFYGTGSGCTFIAGVPSYNYQKHTAGLYAKDGSKIGLHGPTVISQFGVDALAESNSVIEICPPHKKGTSTYDSSGFDLDTVINHTSVELHSTRACLVADSNSTIKAKDLGDYAKFWGAAAIADSGYRSDDMGTSAYTSNGSLQFFPNPQNAVLCASGGEVQNVVAAIPTWPSFTEVGNQNQYLDTTNYVTGPDFNSLSALTLGGMCVRALGNSVVEVDNVHFPIGTADNALNKAWFDASGDTCHRLMIWNIADQSKLKASNLSVSGSYPGDAGYYGPSAIWLDSAGDTASGAPTGTPNTGKLSILDSYGAGSSVFVLEPGTSYNAPFNNYYPYNASDAGIHQEISDGGLVVSSSDVYLYGASGTGVQANRGIFRLYFSVSPEAKYLTAENTDEVGIAHQIFSQGYNFSGTLSALALDGVADSLAVSAISQKLLKLYDSDGDGILDTLGTSGFYYCSEFVEENPTQCMLDESAADSFANAKNCALGGSGRPKKVTIYRSRLDTDRASDAYAGDSIAGTKSSNVFDLERDN
tara:strand:+ start:1910 stop:5338 length:3429 start_codon:yes stop_codon:yes gene_type:complete